MFKKIGWAFTSVCLSVLVTLWIVNYEAVSVFLTGSLFFIFLGKQLSYLIPASFAVWFYWYKKGIKDKEDDLVSLKAALYQLKEDFNSSVNIFCSTVDKWLDNKKGIVFQKFSFNIGELKKIDKKEVVSLQSVPVELLEKIVNLEDKLIWLYNMMHELNLVMDRLDKSEEDEKQEIFSYFVKDVCDILRQSISYGKQFKEVTGEIFDELRKQGVKWKMDESGLDDIMYRAYALDKFLSKVTPVLPQNKNAIVENCVKCDENGQVTLLLPGAKMIRIHILELIKYENLKNFIGTAAGVYGSGIEKLLVNKIYALFVDYYNIYMSPKGTDCPDGEERQKTEGEAHSS